MIAVLDYGMGNVHSVASALRAVAPTREVCISADSAQIAAAERVVFPGVGAIAGCMEELERRGIGSALRAAVDAGKPVLAICVGLQALMQHSDENGGVSGLGILAGQIKPFPTDMRDPEAASEERLKVPHMGWNQVHFSAPHPLWEGLSSGEDFYFVHSYYLALESLQSTAEAVGHCHYGLEFCAAVARDNLFAVQFHPEKSHRAGLALLRNFCTWNGKCSTRESRGNPC